MSLFTKIIIGIVLGLFLLLFQAWLSSSEEIPTHVSSPDIGYAYFNPETRNLMVMSPKNLQMIMAIFLRGNYKDCWWDLREKLSGKLVMFDLGGIPIINFVMSDEINLIRNTKNCR
jgi:hypothetical protein